MASELASKCYFIEEMLSIKNMFTKSMLMLYFLAWKNQ